MMKNLISNILKGAAGLSAATLIWSCASENPFDTEGMGTVRLHTVVNSITTRAIDSSEETALRNNCVVYITEKDKGLVYKEKGLDNVKDQISLKAGEYIAEAWSGDSVSASFVSKFYRGYETFSVTKNSASTVVLNCRIKNVVASINTSTIDPNLMNDDYVITIKNAGGSLTYTKAEGDSRGYFMMADNEKNLTYTIAGTRKDGKKFSKNGTIEVEQAHHYIFNILYDPEIPDDPDTGGAFIKIEIQDENLIDPGIVLIASRPTITGVDFDIRNQVVCVDDENIPENISLQICGFDGLDDVEFTPKCCSWATLLGDAANGKLTGNKTVNFTKASTNIINLCKDNGIEFSEPEMNADNTVATAFLTISKDVIRRLPKQGKEHKFLIKVVDDGGRETIDSLCIARSEAAIRVADPIEVYSIDDNDYMAVLAHSAKIPFKLSSTYDGADIRGVEYTKKGENDWKFIAATEPSAIRRRVAAPAGSPTVIITGLESGTTYQYRARCGEFTGSQINEFTTEAPFIIPNAGMEEWSAFSENSNVLLPGAGGERTFWDSGNHGSATMSVTLTQGSTDMFHSPSMSAKLRSQFVGLGGFAGKFAAGNLFAGTYLETQGTDGRLEFGRPYNSSHPSALSVWVNYRPDKADKNGSKNGHLALDELDSGQIYVALSTEPVEIRTKSSTRKLFNPDDPCILAYGEYTFDHSNYGPDGALQELRINLDYNERAQKNKSLYLIIVCSASKFGDYFDGGEGSTMYVDDFELIYE